MTHTINRRIAAALCDIGITTIEREDACGFLDKVAINHGEIHYQPDAPTSNILHEAGHLACLPPVFRPIAHGSMTHVQKVMGQAMMDRMNETGNPDDPFVRAIMQCSDPEATAWAWAFGVRQEMQAEAIILDTEYDGAGDSIRLQLSIRQYAGINGLRAAGMIGSTRDYPRLSKWIQDAV